MNNLKRKTEDFIMDGSEDMASSNSIYDINEAQFSAGRNSLGLNDNLIP